MPLLKDSWEAAQHVILCVNCVNGILDLQGPRPHLANCMVFRQLSPSMNIINTMRVERLVHILVTTHVDGSKAATKQPDSHHCYQPIHKPAACNECFNSTL